MSDLDASNEYGSDFDNSVDNNPSPAEYARAVSPLPVPKARVRPQSARPGGSSTRFSEAKPDEYETNTPSVGFEGSLESIPMSAWTEEMVQSFLLGNGFEPYVTTFQQNDVDGEVLTKLTRASLKSELGIQSLGAREKIIKAIDSMRIRQQLTKRPSSPSRPIRPQSAGSMRGRSASPMQSPSTRTLSIERMKKMAERLSKPVKHEAPKKNMVVSPKKWSDVGDDFLGRLQSSLKHHDEEVNRIRERVIGDQLKPWTTSRQATDSTDPREKVQNFLKRLKDDETRRKESDPWKKLEEQKKMTVLEKAKKYITDRLKWTVIDDATIDNALQELGFSEKDEKDVRGCKGNFKIQFFYSVLVRYEFLKRYHQDIDTRQERIEKTTADLRNKDPALYECTFKPDLEKARQLSKKKTK